MTNPSGSMILLLCMLVAATLGQFVQYRLSYASTDCSGSAGLFVANNQTSCTPQPCAAFGTGSIQFFCFAGTLQALANPVSCPGCAYCGSVGYVVGSNCAPNSWSTSTVERLGVCVNQGTASSIAYGCTSFGTPANSTTYSDAACTIPSGPTIPPAQIPCVAGQPQCQSTPPSQDYCSYTNLFNGGGGGGQNGTHGAASMLSDSVIFLVLLMWATL